MGGPEIAALALSGALLLYVLSGGADFGGGMWDLAARGPRAAAQRRLIERAIAPVWEANHVWLIVAVVLLFTAFPPAFAALANRLHLPLTLLLVGIVLRGSAFVFRQYGPASAGLAWARVFAVASAVTPFFLGAVLGAVTSGAARQDDLLAWLTPLPIAAGVAATVLCAYLAAVYLTVEAERRAQADPALAGALALDFRRRAIVAWLALSVAAAATTAAAMFDAPRFATRLFASPWSMPLISAGGAAGVAALGALLLRHYRSARIAAVLQTCALAGAWGAAHAPLLIAPDLSVRSAAAPAATLDLLLPVLVAGAVLVLPALYFLLRVFKSRPEA
jgi:cytochrome bd ubiquinol oxidase subunit II